MKQKLYICYNKNTNIMDLQTRKYEFIQKLFNVNESVFEQLEGVLNRQSKSTKKISLEQYNKEIDEANIRIDNGEFYTQDEVEKMAREW